MAVVLPIETSIGITVANIIFLWLFTCLVQVDETQCAVPIDIKVEVVTQTKKPLLYNETILYYVPEAEPLDYRRHRQRTLQKPDKIQGFLYLLQGYNDAKHSQEDYRDEYIYDKYDGNWNHQYYNHNYKPDKTQYEKLNNLQKVLQHMLFEKLIKNSDKESEESDSEEKETLSNPSIPEMSKKYYSRYGTSQKNIDTSFHRITPNFLQQFINLDILWDPQTFLGDRSDTDDRVGELYDEDVSQVTNRKPKNKIITKNYGKGLSDIQKLLNGLNQIGSSYESDASVSSSNVESFLKSSEYILTQKENLVDSNRAPGIKFRFRRFTTSREEANFPDSGSWWGGHFENDDYQPFLGPRPNPYPEKTLPHGTAIFLSQAIPILKSMIKVKGIEHSPYPKLGPFAAPYRVAWQDLIYYDESVSPPEPGPRSYRRFHPKFQTNNVAVRKYNGTEKLKPINIKDLNMDTLASYRRKVPKNYSGLKMEPQMMNIVKAPLKVTPKSELIRVYWQKVTTTEIPPVIRNILNRKVTNDKAARRAEERKRAPKKLNWWPKRKSERSAAEKNKFVFDKNKNYTIILKLF